MANQMQEPYTPQSRLLAQLLAKRHQPVQSVGQGIADVIGDLGAAYGQRTMLDRDEAKQESKASILAKAVSMAMNPQLSQSNIDVQQGNFQQAQPAFPNGAPPNAEAMMNGADPMAAQGAFPKGYTKPVSTQARGLASMMAMRGDPQSQAQFGPEVMQLAQSMAPPMPKALPAGKPGESIPMQNPDGTITFQTVPGVARDPNAPLSPEAEAQKIRIALAGRAPAQPKPAEASSFAFDKKLKTNRRVTNEEFNADPTNFAPPTTAPQVKLFNTAGQEIGTGDPNDPTVQERISSGEVRTAPPRQFSGEQSKAGGFANDALTAETDVEKLLNPIGPDGKPGKPKYDPTGYWTGWSLSNASASGKKQLYDQAKSRWGMAVKRQESGAAVSPAEGLEYADTFFPRVGEGKEQIDQKKTSRDEKIKGIIAASGGAYEANFGGDKTSGPPQGIDPTVWDHMTPEEKALFKK